MSHDDKRGESLSDAEMVRRVRKFLDGRKEGEVEMRWLRRVCHLAEKQINGGEQSGDVRKPETAQAGVGTQMPRDGSTPSAPSAIVTSENVLAEAQALIADYAKDAERPSALRRGSTLELRLAEAVVDYAMRMMRQAEKRAKEAAARSATRLTPEVREALITCKAMMIALAAGKPTRNLDEVVLWIDRLSRSDGRRDT